MWVWSAEVDHNTAWERIGLDIDPDRYYYGEAGISKDGTKIK